VAKSRAFVKQIQRSFVGNNRVFATPHNTMNLLTKLESSTANSRAFVWQIQRAFV